MSVTGRFFPQFIHAEQPAAPLSRNDGWAIGAFVLLALVIVGPMFGGQFGTVDDHQVPYFIRLVASDGFWPATAHWVLEHDGRFRPLYWPIYYGEMMLWGPTVAGYVLDRLVLTLATLTAGYAVFRLWFPAIPSTIGAALVVAGPQAAAFWMLGSQEAWAMPMCLGAVALVGRRRFWGLGLAVLAAYIKEPFILTGAATCAWAWWLGGRRSVAVAGGLIVAAGAMWSLAMLRYGFFYQSGIPLAARYLLPPTVALGFAGAWLARRSRLGLELAVAVAAAGLIVTVSQASAWSAETVRYASMIDELRADGRPVVVTWYSNPEYPVAILHYLTQPVAADPPLDGFASVTGDCVEVAVGEPRSPCSTVIRFR